MFSLAGIELLHPLLAPLPATARLAARNIPGGVPQFHREGLQRGTFSPAINASQCPGSPGIQARDEFPSDVNNGSDSSTAY